MGAAFASATLEAAGCAALAPVAIASVLAPAAVVASFVLVVESRPNNHHAVAVGVLRAVHDLIF